MKKCPYCTKEIQDDAIVCKHCGNDLIPRKNPRSLRKRPGPGNNALWGLGFLILSIIVFAISQVMRQDMTSSTYYAFESTTAWLACVGAVVLIVALVRKIVRRKKNGLRS